MDAGNLQQFTLENHGKLRTEGRKEKTYRLNHLVKDTKFKTAEAAFTLVQKGFIDVF